MLLKALASAFRRHEREDPPLATSTLPLEEEQSLQIAHGRAPIDRHLDILLGDYRVGEQPFVELYRRCMQATGTVVTPFNVFQRYETRRLLCQYLFATLEVPGLLAECGVYRGATALLLCHAVRSRRPAFRGEGMHLIDSFCGTSAPVAQDFIPMREAGGSVQMKPFFVAGKTDTSAELVKGYFAAEFPQASIHPGWIPQVFTALPQARWAYVHVDVTLFEPTVAALEYFWPRMSPGGAILCDGSIFCPGAESAVRHFCDRNAVAYALLGHREYVLIRDAD